MFIDDFAGRWLVSHREGRPDWVTRSTLPRKAVWSKRLDQHNKAAPECIEGDPSDTRFVIREHGIRYQIDFGAGYSQGLFLDQRDNRAEVGRRAAGLRVLNCFSYTCGFSVSAAVAGAESTTSIDLSSGYLDWGKENFALNGIDLASAEHYFCRGDSFEWLAQFRRKRRSFGAVVLDPPTFSRSKRGGVFRVERDYARLTEAATRLLAKGGWLLACCNHRALSARQFRESVREGVLAAGGRISSLDMRPMPPDFRGEPYLKSAWVDLK